MSRHQLQRLLSAGGAEHQPAFGEQQPAQRGEDILLVVDQQQGALSPTPPKQRRIDLPAVAQHRFDRCRR